MRYEVRFTPTSGDIVTGFRMHNRQPDNIWKLCVFGAVGLALVFGVAGYIMQYLGVAITGAVAGTAVLGMFLLQDLPIRRQARNVTGEEVTYILSDDGVQFQSSIDRSKLAWGAFTEARLDERGMLLYTDQMTFSFIPARAFEPGDFPRNEIRALLDEKLKKA